MGEKAKEEVQENLQEGRQQEGAENLLEDLLRARLLLLNGPLEALVVATTARYRIPGGGGPMSRLPQAGPTSGRLQKRGEQRRGAEDHDPKCEPWQKRCSDPTNLKKDQKDGIAGPAHTSVRIR